MKSVVMIAALLLGLFAGRGEARADADLFRPLAWGMSIENVRKYYNLIGPTDIGGRVNVYVSPDNPFGDIYGDLIFNFHAGKLARFRVFLGEKDSGDRFRAALRVLNNASGWSQIFLKAGSVEIPLLVKPALDPLRPPPSPPASFDEAKSVWVETAISDEALYVFKQKRSFRDFMKAVTARDETMRGAIVSLHKGFVTANFAPARELIQELEQPGGDTPQTVMPQDSGSKDLDLLKPVAPK